MFERTKITTLMAWGFGIVIALIAIMAGIIYQQSSVIRADVTDIADNSYPKVTAAAAIRFNIMRNWSNTLLLMGISETNEVKRIEAEMTANSKAITEHFEFLEKRILSEKGKQILGEALKARKRYTDNRKKYLEMLKTGSRDDAYHYLVATLQADVNAYADSLGDLIKFQSAKMENDTAVIRADAGSLQTANIVISLLVALISVATAIIVIRVIGRLLGGDVHYANQVAREIAGGNLGVDVQIAPNDNTSLLASMKAMRDRLRSTVGSIHASAEELGRAASQLVQTSGAVASASAQQSEATSATAAAVEQMTVGVDHIARNAQEAQSFSQQAEQLSRKGGEVIQDAASEMGKIADSVESSSVIIGTLEQQSSEISAVVNVIKEIADQTNLLALNAAIEAARAGEQGRGFAVVADEVRKLAERTTLSTQEIATTIGKIQSGTQNAVQSMVAGVDQVRSGTSLARQAGESIMEIQSGAHRVADVVSSISDSLREQSVVSNEIAKNIENIARMVEENNSSAEQAAAAASQLQRLAEELSVSIRSFRL